METNETLPILKTSYEIEINITLQYLGKIFPLLQFYFNAKRSDAKTLFDAILSTDYAETHQALLHNSNYLTVCQILAEIKIKHQEWSDALKPPTQKNRRQELNNFMIALTASCNIFVRELQQYVSRFNHDDSVDIGYPLQAGSRSIKRNLRSTRRPLR